MTIARPEGAGFLLGFWMRMAVAAAMSCIAASASAASSHDSDLPEGTRPMTAGEIYELYKDKSWQWDDGAGRMTGGADRTFSAWTDGEEGKSWAEGRWIITETGRMCLNATWHTEHGAFPAKTCFSHRIGNGAIHLMREPDGEWFMFRHAEIRDGDEANKLVSADLVTRQRDNIKTVLGAASSHEQ